jgi:hypothetical protein
MAVYGAPHAIATGAVAAVPILAVVAAADPSRLVSLAVATVLSGLLIGRTAATIAELMSALAVRCAR